MTKKQNRSFGFGKRTLSVLLAVLMVLSTMVVMLSVTSLSAGAAISYWFVSGNFNNWTSSATTANKINSGSGGSVTIPMTASSIQFKMIAYEGGNKWCGNASGSATVGAETELSWDSGKNISVALPANTTAVTFSLAVKNGKNYVTVTATTSGGGDTPTPTGESHYTAKVNPNNSANSQDAIFWADATYFDYLSDKELDNGWLYPDHVGTSNFNDNIDEWYPFYRFNRNVVKSVADSNSGWSKPLYFGNFCNTYNAYDTSHHPGVTNGYNDATNSYNVTRFDYAANNSNGVYDMHSSVQGLMNSSLNNGMLQTPDGTLAPYFNEDALSGYAKTVKSAFPFRKIDKGTYMRYEFDSTNANDNVYFTWETQNGVTYPKYVNYGEGATYGVKDGLKEFMNTNSGYGIFPFNNASSSYKGTKTNTNEQLDYGFGIRMDMKFRVPENTDVKFDFSGDDDLWMYITDPDGNSQLVLDMGGSHKESEGVVDFNNGVATVFDVDDPTASNKDIWVMEESSWGNVMLYAWDNNNNGEWYTGTSSSNLYRFRDNLIGSNGNPLSSKTKFLYAKDTSFTGQSGDLNISSYTGKCIYTKNGSVNTSNTVSGHSKEAKNYFTFDPSKTYTMTIFYMERGLIESNCKMGFTMTPLGNNFIVTEEINTANVNDGLKDVVSQLSQFGFNPYEGGSQISDSFYKDFALGDGERADISNSVLPIDSNVKVRQYAPSNTYLTYDTSWKYYDNTSNPRKLLSQGTGVTSNGVTTITDEQTIINESGDKYDYAELQVDYVNTPRVTDVSVTKTVQNYATLPDNMKNDEFPATILLQFTSDMTPTAYKLVTSDGTIDFANGGKVMLKHNKTVTISGVPVGTRVSVVEDLTALDAANHKYTQSGGTGVAGSGDITITNEPATVQPIYADVPGTKRLDGDFYTGDLFGFVLNGLAPFPGDDDTVVNTLSQTELATYEVTDGSFKLGDKTTQDATKALKFSKPGTYRYVVREDISALEDTDDLIGTTYSSDIIQSRGTPMRYLVEFNVILQGDNTLKANGPLFFDYDTGVPAGEMVFFNEVKKGAVTVEKKDQAGTALKGVTFAVYAVPDTFETTDKFSAYGNKTFTQLSADEQYKAVKASGSPVKTGVTNDSGIANIADLPIYKSAFYPNTTLYLNDLPAEPHQRYVLLESSGPSGYAINQTLNFFTIPTNGSYAFTFSGADAYINGVIKNPDAGGIKGVLFTGIGIVALASVLLMAYVLYMKKRGYAPAHFKKK